MTLIRQPRINPHRGSGDGSAAGDSPSTFAMNLRSLPDIRPDSWDGDFYGDEDIITRLSDEMFPGEYIAMTVAFIIIATLLALVVLAQVTIALGWAWAIGLLIVEVSFAAVWVVSEAVK